MSIEDLDCEVHLITENKTISKDTPSTDLLFHEIKVVLAKNFLKNLSEEVRKGMREKAAQGIWPSFAPIGYLNAELPNGKRGIILDRFRAPIIRRCYEMYATGHYSIRAIAKWAADAGLTFRGKRHRKITRSAVQVTFENCWEVPPGTIARFSGNDPRGRLS